MTKQDSQLSPKALQREKEKTRKAKALRDNLRRRKRADNPDQPKPDASERVIKPQ